MQIFEGFLSPLYKDIKTLVLDTLFPIYCLVCEKEGKKFICEDCKNKLTPLPHQFCIICQKSSLGGLTHPKCHTPHSADGLISLFDYHDPKVADILIKGKYSFLPQVYKELGAIMAEMITRDLAYILNPKSEIVNLKLTAIPLHKWRQRWRGFNQAQVLAETIAKSLNLEIIDVLVRKKLTKTQKDLKKEERIKNIDSAFAISSKFLNFKSKILNHQFVLIDDVTTTGSTLKEAAQVLKRNGAAQVFCLTVARD